MLAPEKKGLATQLFLILSTLDICKISQQLHKPDKKL
jgi:hypothetical protein